MRRLKQVLLVILLLIVALFILTFILENTTEVSINFISFSTPHIALSVLLIISFVLGLIFALIISHLALLKIRVRLARVKKQLKMCQKQPTNNNPVTKTLPLQ